MPLKYRLHLFGDRGVASFCSVIGKNEIGNNEKRGGKKREYSDMDRLKFVKSEGLMRTRNLLRV
jgi:hypothetical protein